MIMLRNILRSRYVVLPAIMIILSLLIWFFGPAMAYGSFRPFETPTARIIGIAVVVTIIVLILLISLWLRRRKNRKMTKEIVEAATKAVDPSDVAAAEEMRELGGRMAEAMDLLKKSKIGGGGGKYLYQLPWYIIIGPPGAGKTTAIVKSGLQFPLADKMGANAIGGVGGTRNCDWWFTNDAVLIDTAGRYTTQDSDASVDSTAWVGFLGLLKKYRKRQPINGALIAISLSDLSMQDEAQRRAHALAIRARLRELHETLGVRFPVYVLFTKADLIAGFTEFFEDLGREDRAQVWGFTFPFDKGKDAVAPMSKFDEEFDILLAQLNDRSLERVQAESDHARRSMIYGFTQQVASLKQVAHDFLDEVFQQNRFEERQLLRGVYFTSGTQEGTPIDRLMMSMAKTFGIGRQAIGTGQGAARSFFLNRLLAEVIFKEAGLVSSDDKVERRYKWIIRGSLAVALLVTLGSGLLWALSFLGNRDLIAEARADVERYQEMVADIPINPVEDTDIARVVEPLNILRALPGNPARGKEVQPPAELTFGLYQGDKVGSEAIRTYRGALNQLLLPRLLLRLEQQLQANINNADLLYEGLKVYLTLGLQAPTIDREMVTQWMLIDWGFMFPGAQNAELRGALAAHLETMLTQPMKQISLNGPLVAQVRAILAATPQAERTYQALLNSPEARALPEWRVGDVGGPATSRALIRISGAPMTEGIAGVYTHAGFNDYFLPAVADVAERVQEESWIMGERGQTASGELNLALLSRDVLNLYYADYVREWERVLGDIDIVPVESANHATEVINILSGPNSPIRNILESATEETRLAERASAIDLSQGAESLGDFAVRDVASGLDSRTQLLLSTLSGSVGVSGIGGGGEAAPAPGMEVQQRFQWLHDFVLPPQGGSGGGASQLDVLMAQMGEVYNELARVGVAGFSAAGAGGGGGGAADRLLIEAARLPPGPIQRLATQVAQGAKGAAMGGMRAQINAQWQAKVLPLCRQALANRYPFTRGANAEVALADFARLFAPNGLIDSFFTQNLIQFVDASSKPWKWTPQADDLGIPAAVLTQFQRAGEIRDSFFLAGPTPTVTFTITPLALDAQATEVILEVDGQQLSYAHGPIGPTAMTWPGQAGGRTRVALQPPLGGSQNSIQTEGVWSFFKLLDSASVGASRRDAFEINFNVGGRAASFSLQAGSVLNPFSLPALRGFGCPASM